jgi:hypothetical protein
MAAGFQKEEGVLLTLIARVLVDAQVVLNPPSHERCLRVWAARKSFPEDVQALRPRLTLETSAIFGSVEFFARHQHDQPFGVGYLPQLRHAIAAEHVHENDPVVGHGEQIVHSQFEMITRHVAHDLPDSRSWLAQHLRQEITLTGGVDGWILLPGHVLTKVSVGAVVSEGVSDSHTLKVRDEHIGWTTSQRAEKREVVSSLPNETSDGGTGSGE